MPESVVDRRGTKPPGTSSESEASRRVREMFGRIAPRYDLLNHVLSLQIDRLWRRRAARRVREILQRKDALVLDLCCGTGDLGLALRAAGRARVLGADFTHGMLQLARKKAGQQISFAEADALRLPFADCRFDLVATAFGFRNLSNYSAGLREILRVLKPGGTLAILEFTEPGKGFLAGIYRWYFRHVLPRIGGLISGDSYAYSYLPSSVAGFFEASELARSMEENGFVGVSYERWTGGALALHLGRRP